MVLIFFELCFKAFPMGYNCSTGVLCLDCYSYLQFSENLRHFSELFASSEGSAT